MRTTMFVVCGFSWITALIAGFQKQYEVGAFYMAQAILFYLAGRDAK